MTSAPYTKVGKNQVIEIESTVIIGKGASSRVFSGKFDHKDVAVKRVYKDEYTKRELDLIRLFEHENIVRYLYKDFDDNFIFIVMEKCDCNLQEFIDDASFQSKKRISRIEILDQTTNGLAYLHDIMDIIHRDIKPSNTLLLLQGQKWVVRITDFGISKQLPQNKSKLTQTSIKGTSGNTAPEALNNEKISKKSDIFSLGILFHFTLSGGKHPYGTDMLNMDGIIRDGKQQPTMGLLDKKYAVDAKSLILSMIAHKCEDRFDITHVKSHHFFWNNEKKLNFIQVVSDYAIAKTTSNIIETKLNENSERVIGESWRASVYAVSPVIKEVLKEMRLKKQGDDIMSLLRNIRNLMHHFIEKPSEFKNLMVNGGSVNNMEFFFNMFPALISHVYEVMRSVELENPIFKNFFYAKKEPRPVSPAQQISSKQVLTGTTADESLATTSKAMTEKDSLNWKKYVMENPELRAVGFECMDESWRDALRDIFYTSDFLKMCKFVENERKKLIPSTRYPQTHVIMEIYPDANDVFSWTLHCKPEEVKVVIVGQDPCHNKEASGLAFSAKNKSCMLVPTRNIFKALKRDLGKEFVEPNHGNLEGWAKQGVLLLNLYSTVENSKDARPHFVWDSFIHAVINWISGTRNGVVFMLWGKRAKDIAVFINQSKHLVLEAYHPTSRDYFLESFLNCGHFSQANQYLGVGNEINWSDL